MAQITLMLSATEIEIHLEALRKIHMRTGCQFFQVRQEALPDTRHLQKLHITCSTQDYVFWFFQLGLEAGELYQIEKENH